MIIKRDTRIGQWIIPAGFETDGCTFPGVLKYLKGIMKAKEYYLGCALHDFLRRYAIVPVPEVDKELKWYICDVNHDHIRAHLYWLAVKLMRLWFQRTQPLPAEWEKYRNPVTPEITEQRSTS